MTPGAASLTRAVRQADRWEHLSGKFTVNFPSPVSASSLKSAAVETTSAPSWVLAVTVRVTWQLAVGLVGWVGWLVACLLYWLIRLTTTTLDHLTNLTNRTNQSTLEMKKPTCSSSASGAALSCSLSPALTSSVGEERGRRDSCGAAMAASRE